MRHLYLLSLLFSIYCGALVYASEQSLSIICSLQECIQEKQNASSLHEFDFSDAEAAWLWEDLLGQNSELLCFNQANQYFYSALEQAQVEVKNALLDRAAECLQLGWIKLHPYLEAKPEMLRMDFSSSVAASKTNIEKKIAPYLLPKKHPFFSILGQICSGFRVLKDEEHLRLAGFQLLSVQPISHVSIATHSLVPGYLFKLYLDNNPFPQGNLPDWLRLVNRCEGAKNVRDLIQKKKLRYFSVPDKWLYAPAVFPADHSGLCQPVMLIVQNMNLVPPSDNLNAWKTVITPQHLKELYCILSHGFASAYVGPNIPYTVNGQFSCIDTEYVKRDVNLKQVLNFLSPEMQAYWKKLIKSGGR